MVASSLLALLVLLQSAGAPAPPAGQRLTCTACTSAAPAAGPIAGELETRNGVPGAWVSMAVLDDYLTKAGRLRIVGERLGVLTELAAGRAHELEICGQRVDAAERLGADLKARAAAAVAGREAAEAQMGAWYRSPPMLLAVGALMGGALGVWALR